MYYPYKSINGNGILGCVLLAITSVSIFSTLRLWRRNKDLRENGNIDAYLDGFESGAMEMRKIYIQRKMNE